MSEQQPERDLTPQPSRILAEPATVELCNADFDAAVDVRQTMAQQDARQR
jgi:hypothetical protein